mmetsp:Transcript_7795/g.10387  ORF Transcript_7795/g.10387 Transcript_7795/m.10387 type:complete len:340 (+) Transcript_7795:126-1145(+)
MNNSEDILIHQNRSGAMNLSSGNGTFHHNMTQSAMADVERRREQAHHVIIVVAVIFLVGQFSLYKWKTTYPVSYRNVCAIGLWVIPLGISVFHHHWRFAMVSLLYSTATIRILLLSRAKPLAPSTPRATYRWFMWAYYICLMTGISGYLILMLEMVGLRAILHLPKQTIASIGGTMLFYGLYFGLLGRDVAEVCAECISSTLGYTRRSREGHSPSPSEMTICALCGEDLPSVDGMEDGGGYKETASKNTPPRSHEKMFKLDCGHCFHESCIRGWTIVGKKDTCPHCLEKVELRSLLSSSPWLKQSLVWINLLDALRYLIVWNPLFLVLAHFVLTLWTVK